MAEVPQGKGRLDLAKIIGLLRKASPKVPLHLEMITRDPLVIPCLTDRYWGTFDAISARQLAKHLVWIKTHSSKTPLPK